MLQIKAFLTSLLGKRDDFLNHPPGHQVSLLLTMDPTRNPMPAAASAV